MTRIYSFTHCNFYSYQCNLIIFGFDVQEGVAIEIAEAVVGALKGELAATAVNAPMVPAEVSLYLYLLTVSRSSFLY
jgi:hypothetical protein